MADATPPFGRSVPPQPTPPDWAQAFAALPDESAPPEVWPALAVRARRAREARRRRAWRGGFALAATLACAVIGLALWSLQGGIHGVGRYAVDGAETDGGEVPRRAVADSATAADAPAPVAGLVHAGDAAQDGVASRAGADPPPAARAPVETGAASAAVAAARVATRAETDTAAAGPTSLPGPRRGERPRRSAPPRAPAAEGLVLPVERRLAQLDTGIGGDLRAGTETGDRIDGVTGAAPLADASGAHDPASAPADENAALQRLQARSAQLEAWLGLLRDPSVGTGPGALIAAELDDRLAGIDAALAAVPGDQSDLQRELWQARVIALQRALAFETRVRTLAAEGRHYDGALVAVD